LRGRIIAFGGRALEKDVPAKYLNSPETPLFHKGGTLYNIATARAAAHKGAPLIAVEGYVDVIAMVTAGFEATVAPLGTALTEDQLTLAWKMADEPILCFDGDKAGRRAAYRALDLALPRLAPGKSLRFALLPEGQDPDDLARAGGRQAIEEVLAAAQPLAQMLWVRETESGSFDTPERRAALEARVGEVTAAIQDETVRRYYRQDFGGRLRAMFSPQQANPQRREWTERRPGGSGGWTPGGAGGNKGGGRFGAPKTPPGYLQTGVKYIANSPELAAGPLHGGHRSMIPRREALILQTVLNHPWLLHDHMEELAEFEFRQPEAQRLKSALIDICAHGDGDRAEVAAALNARGLGDLVAKVERAITTHSVFGAGPEAGAEDVLLTWKQLIALHRQRHSLIKELKDAEMATAQDESEESFNWLRDVKARLAEIDGIEALVDGFGAASGRPSRGG
jgi:DNA primase